MVGPKGGGGDPVNGGGGGSQQATTPEPDRRPVDPRRLEDEREEAKDESRTELLARIAGLERSLAEAREEAASVARRYEIDRVLGDSGAIDAETARVMTEALIAEMRLDDVEEAVTLLRERKPFLFSRGGGAGGGIASGVMSAAPAAGSAATLDELAERARASGDRRELARYLRARRTV